MTAYQYDRNLVNYCKIDEYADTYWYLLQLASQLNLSISL